MNDNDHIHSPLEYQFTSMNLGQTSPSKTNEYSPLPNAGLAANPQSASARFERFFASGPSMGETLGSPGYQPGFSPLRGGSPSPYGNIGGAVPSNVGLAGSMGGPFSAGPSCPPVPGSHPTVYRARSPMTSTGPDQSRSGIPSHWGLESPLGNGALGLNASSPISPNAPSLVPLNSFYAPQPFQGPPVIYPTHLPGPPASDPNDDDVIPTAIVVKNIPFSVKKEQLLQIIEELAIPMPYAFNYHFDQGVFRGLAFANFRSAEEADAVVAALNGFDVSGRKLRVEYKKVLQAGEKERIEKEKAIKRMRSMVMEKERIKRESGYGSAAFGAGDLPPLPPLPGQTSPLPPALSLIGNNGGESRDSHPPSTTYLDPTFVSPSTLPQDATHPTSIPPGASTADSEHSSAVPCQVREELNLNDPQTLEIYSRVLLFKDDRMRDELAFSRSLSPLERRTVHLVAQKLNLYHYSLGEGDERHVIVAKHEVSASSGQHRPLRTQASTIGRSGREAVNSGSVAMGGSGSTSRSGLRGKKSAPDMKRNRDSGIASTRGGNFNGSAFNFSGGAGASYSSANGTNTATSSISSSFIGRKSNGNLRDSYSSSALGGLMAGASSGQRRSHQGGGGVGGAVGLQSLFASQFEVPPVPSLGSAYLGSAPPLSSNLSSHSSGSDANFLARSDSPLSASSAAGHQGQGQQGSLHHHTLTTAISSGALRQPRGPPTPSGQGAPTAGDIRNFGPRTRLSAQSITTTGSSSSSHSQGHSSSINLGAHETSSNGTSLLSSHGGAGKTRSGSGHGGGLDEGYTSPLSAQASLSNLPNQSWRQQPRATSPSASVTSSTATLQQPLPPSAQQKPSNLEDQRNYS